MIRRIIIIFCLLSLIGCTIIPKRCLSTYGNNLQPDETFLRTDGYFYKIDSVNNKNEKIAPEIKWFVLYQDGTILQSFQMVSNFKSFPDFENSKFLRKGDQDYPIHDFPFNNDKNTWWGSYSINKPSIKLQYFASYEIVWSAIERRGIILNDSTILINFACDLNGHQANMGDSIHDIYKFRYFKNKPDSINWMMEDHYYKKRRQSRIKNYAL